jgi:hypothetical protein
MRHRKADGFNHLVEHEGCAWPAYARRPIGNLPMVSEVNGGRRYVADDDRSMPVGFVRPKTPQNVGIVALRNHMPSQPVRYTPSVETVSGDEAQTIEQLKETLLKIAGIVFEDSGHAFRSVHAKSHGIIEGELEVLSGLDPELAQGLFAKVSKFPVIVRLSTIAGDILEDSVSIPRGIAIKVIGVEGDRLPGSEADRTQDFLMADGPVFAAPTAKKFLANLKRLAKTTDKAPTLKKALSYVLRGIEAGLESVRAESATLKTLGGHPNNHILGASFYSQAPIRYGDFIAKMALFPVSPELTALKEKMVDVGHDPDALRTAVREFFRAQTATWELRVQLCTDLKTMPIEEASVRWPEDQSPYRPVARITANAQDSWSDDKVRRVDDGMSFSPWHGLAAHRPLGSVMRARKNTYSASASFRGEHNGCPMREPTV